MPYTVFPLHPFSTEGVCCCSEGEACRRAGKHPAIRWGELGPGVEIFGPAGHGIATGIRSGVFVVDTDGPEADVRYRELCDPEDLETYTVTTPSGGRHYYYAWPGFPVRNSAGELDWSEAEDGFNEEGKPVSSRIDVRGDGGFVVMPGSPHKSGRTYDVEKNLAPRVAPAWLAEWPGLKGREITASAGAPDPVDVNTDEGKRRLELGRVACETFPADADGTGGGPLFNLSLRLIRDLELPLDAALALVVEHYNPRCTDGNGDPYPWGNEEIRHKLEDARDKSDRACGIPSEGWAEKLIASARQAPEVTRKQRNPAHTYECSIGTIVNITPSKTHQAEVTAELFGNPSWAGVLQHDVFRDRVFAVDPPIELCGAEKGEFCDEDLTAIVHWFACMGGKAVTNDAAWKSAMSVAKSRTNRYHPLLEYLEGLSPVSGAIEGLCAAMGLPDPFDHLYVRRFLIAAVRRVYAPGCKVDNMLVLKGDPGLKKSTFVIELFGQEWASENLTNIEDAKAVGEVMAGKWAVEVAEMKEIMRAGNETVAAFITRRVERFRAAYARGNAVDRPRSCVLVGSTNENDLLRNVTGADARRFWIVEPEGVTQAAGPKQIDVEWIRANRDNVWGEAVELSRQGERHWLEGEEAVAHMARVKKYEERDPWHDAITIYCTGRETVRVEDMWKNMGGTADKLDQKTTRRITDSLRRLGCERVAMGKQRVRVWVIPEDVKKGEIPDDERVRRASEAAVIALMKN